MIEPKILIGVTTYEGKDYIFDQCMQHIARLDYKNFDVVIVDNTKKIDYFLKLRRRGYKNVYRVERGENSRTALTKSQNRIRQLFLEKDYDYLLMVESDLLIPPDSIKRLLSHNKPVVGSVYMIGTNGYQVPCIFVDDVVKDGFMATRPLGVKIRDDGKKFANPEEVQKFLTEGPRLKKVHGVGFGCTLIERRIVEKYPFWFDIRRDDAHSDIYFYLDLSRDKVPVFVDLTTIVPHYPSKWELVADK